MILQQTPRALGVLQKRPEQLVMPNFNSKPGT
jgi:hypothetical protein